jgi:hypothetical protein
MRESHDILSTMPTMGRFLSAVALVLPLVSAQDTGSIVGTVINGISGASVAGMNMFLWAKGGRTVSGHHR